MSTVVHDQELDTRTITRSAVIRALRAAVSAAEAGEDVVQVIVGNVEMHIDLECGELMVYA